MAGRFYILETTYKRGRGEEEISIRMLGDPLSEGQIPLIHPP